MNMEDVYHACYVNAKQSGRDLYGDDDRGTSGGTDGKSGSYSGKCVDVPHEADWDIMTSSEDDIPFYVWDSVSRKLLSLDTDWIWLGAVLPIRINTKYWQELVNMGRNRFFGAHEFLFRGVTKSPWGPRWWSSIVGEGLEDFPSPLQICVVEVPSGCGTIAEPTQDPFGFEQAINGGNGVTPLYNYHDFHPFLQSGTFAWCVYFSLPVPMDYYCTGREKDGVWLDPADHRRNDICGHQSRTVPILFPLSAHMTRVMARNFQRIVNETEPDGEGVDEQTFNRLIELVYQFWPQYAFNTPSTSIMGYTTGFTHQPFFTPAHEIHCYNGKYGSTTYLEASEYEHVGNLCIDWDSHPACG